MIQVYKKNELFIIENTVTDIIYPNLTKEEALVLLEKFDRNETEHRCDFAIKEDDISFEYVSLDDKDKTIAEQRKQITDLEAKLAEKDEQIKRRVAVYEKQFIEQTDKIYKLTQQLEQLEKEKELDNSFWKQECDSLQKTLVEKDKKIDNLYDRLNSKQKFYEMSLEKDYKEYLSRLYKLEKQCDKDKISFAIQQLEKAKELLLEKCGETYSKTYCGIDEDIEEIIGNQINELKGDEVL